MAEENTHKTYSLKEMAKDGVKGAFIPGVFSHTVSKLCVDFDIEDGIRNGGRNDARWNFGDKVTYGLCSALTSVYATLAHVGGYMVAADMALGTNLIDLGVEAIERSPDLEGAAYIGVGTTLFMGAVNMFYGAGERETQQSIEQALTERRERYGLPITT